MAGTGVVDGDEGGVGEPRPQHGLVLGAECLELGGHQPHHLALRDHEAQAGEQRRDPVAGHLALKMQRQHQTNKMRAATADNPRRERRDQGLAVRRLPALAPIERRLGLDRQVLNGDLLIALEARARRRLDRQRLRPGD